MKYINKFHSENECDIQEEDRIQIIVKSYLYCDDDEEPIFHSGTVTEICYGEFSDGKYPVGLYVKFEKDSLYEDQEEELVFFADIEKVIIKKYEISGFAILNDGVTLSVKGDANCKMIWYAYRNGSIIPEFISDGNIIEKKPVTKEDNPFLSEVRKFGEAQRFFHYALSKSGVN